MLQTIMSNSQADMGEQFEATWEVQPRYSPDFEDAGRRDASTATTQREFSPPVSCYNNVEVDLCFEAAKQEKPSIAELKNGESGSTTEAAATRKTDGDNAR